MKGVPFRRYGSNLYIFGAVCAEPDAAVSSADSSSCGAVVLRPERLAGSVVVGVAGVFLHIPAVETRTRQPNKAPRRMGSHLFLLSVAGFSIMPPSMPRLPRSCAFCAIR